MKNTPLISVIMPAYNAGAFIGASIDGILNQTEQDFELIVVNDGSADNTERVVQSYRSDKVKYFANRENIGFARARNKAMRLARGKYIAIADADDISHPRRLEAQAYFMEKHPEVGAVSGQLNQFAKSMPGFDDIADVKRIPLKYTAKQSRSRAVLGFRSAIDGVAMFRRAVIEMHNLRYDSRWRVATDIDLLLRLATVTDVLALDCRLILYRRQGQGHSERSRDLAFEEGRQVAARFQESFLADHFGVDISGVFNAAGIVANADGFLRLNAAIEKVMVMTKTDPRYDAATLHRCAVRYLYRQWREMEKSGSNYAALFSAWRETKLLNHMRVDKKMRVYAKKWLKTITGD